jgi:hypothetical protein
LMKQQQPEEQPRKQQQQPYRASKGSLHSDSHTRVGGGSTHSTLGSWPAAQNPGQEQGQSCNRPQGALAPQSYIFLGTNSGSMPDSLLRECSLGSDAISWQQRSAHEPPPGRVIKVRAPCSMSEAAAHNYPQLIGFRMRVCICIW